MKTRRPYTIYALWHDKTGWFESFDGHLVVTSLKSVATLWAKQRDGYRVVRLVEDVEKPKGDG